MQCLFFHYIEDETILAEKVSKSTKYKKKKINDNAVTTYVLNNRLKIQRLYFCEILFSLKNKCYFPIYN